MTNRRARIQAYLDAHPSDDDPLTQIEAAVDALSKPAAKVSTVPGGMVMVPRDALQDFLTFARGHGLTGDTYQSYCVAKATLQAALATTEIKP